MTNSILAFVLAWFTLFNVLSYALFVRSERRVLVRQPPVSPSLLSTIAIAGGAPMALLAFDRCRRGIRGVIGKPLMASLGVLQTAIVLLLTIDRLVIDII